MNILHYTQHVLGIGHLFRSLAIDAALAPAVVHLVTGGPEVPLALPANVRHHPMPALKMDSEFQAVQTVDLEAQTVTTSDGQVFPFTVDSHRKHCLLNGLDDIGLTLEKASAIDSFEKKHAALHPWA